MNTDEKMTGDLFEVDKRLSLKPVVDFNSYLRSAFGDGACTCIRCVASGGDEAGYAFQHTFSFDGKPTQRRFASTAGSDVLMALKKASQSLDKLLTAQGVDLEDIVSDFKKARKKTASAHTAKNLSVNR